MRKARHKPRSLWGMGARRAVVAVLLGLLLVGWAVTPAGAIPPPPSGPTDLALDPNTGRLYTYLAYDNRILYMDAAGTQPVQIIADVGLPGSQGHNIRIGPMALDPNLGRLYVVNMVEQTPEGASWALFAIDMAQDAIVQQLPLGGPTGVRYDWLAADTAQGKLYAGNPENTVVYDTATLAVLGVLPGRIGALLDGENRRLYLIGWEDLVVINTADDTVVTEMPLPEGARRGGSAIDPSRQRLHTIVEGELHVLDTVSLQWQAPLMGGLEGIGALTVDPADGELYGYGPGDSEKMEYKIYVLSPETGELKATLAFQEPELPAGYGCSGYPWLSVSRLIADPAGGRIYGSGNSMAVCVPEANLAFVVDAEAEALAGWLPYLPELPDTGGRRAGGAWLLLAGSGLLLAGLLLQVARRMGGRDAG
jgi:DNA-binding beta-propeller fold protein YncE